MVDAKAKPAAAPPEPKRLIKPVINAVAVLRRLTATGEPERAIELARALKINPSTCFNILRTLVSEGLLTFDTGSKSYAIGPDMVSLVSRSLLVGQGLDAARPLIQQLAEQFGATATLWRRHGADRLVLVDVQYSPGGVRVHMPIGQRLPILLASLGEASAPHLGLSKEEIRKAFKDLRWGQPPTFEAYWREVKTAAQRGWALDDGQYSQGVTSVAAPIVDHDGRLIYVLASATLRGQDDAAGLEAVGEATAAMARQLGVLLA